MLCNLERVVQRLSFVICKEWLLTLVNELQINQSISTFKGKGKKGKREFMILKRK